VKGALEIMQTSFSALQSAINLVISKLDENNKAVKDLADSMAST
jgi:tRNA A37 threonylcarbamoyltransferase TsaD